MELFHKALICCLFTIGLALQSAAQDRQPDQITPGEASVSPGNTRSLTGKERLGKKWTDEQRIDNCNVPIDKRGSRPRPSNCPHTPSG
jgi:hypothetical protein